jgi:AcrR family transcriptional regulator
MANLVPKVPAQGWLDAARQALVVEGIEAVKVDRLARQLGVTRGGFYHHFADRAELLMRLLTLWEESVVFVPSGPVPANPAQALAAIERLVAHLIDEAGYDPAFDLAVRAWSHADAGVAALVERIDAKRIAALGRIFRALGCVADEAAIRARVFYFHQIGYYAIGVHESRALRLRHAATYLDILCGTQHLTRARGKTQRQGCSTT